MADATTISAINQLIETCRDGEMGFSTAADHVQDPGVRSMFRGIARQRGEFADELKREVVRLGGTPHEGGSVGGAVHRGWMDIRGAVTRRDDTAMLAEAERGEDAALRTYEAALQGPLPSPTETLVRRQFRDVKDAHDRVRALEKEWKQRK